MASASGANLRELMRRMGHCSTRAALIYLHGSPERDREIADEMDRRARETEGKKRRRDDGHGGHGAREWLMAREWPKAAYEDQNAKRPGL
jgi:hypothetical protein